VNGQLQVSADLFKGKEPIVSTGGDAGGPQSRSGSGSEEKASTPAGNKTPGTFLYYLITCYVIFYLKTNLLRNYKNSTFNSMYVYTLYNIGL
jgi:hypothetical protein